MRVQCSYCGERLGGTASDTDDVSHGVCYPCYRFFKRQAEKLSLGEYLSDLRFPVLIVDSDRRVLAANGTMLELLDVGEESVLGRRGGEVVTCSYARRPGGCGSDVCCRSCTVRRTVVATHEDGLTRTRVPATLDTEVAGPIRFYVSAEKLQSGVVRVSFESVEPAGRRSSPDEDVTPDAEPMDAAEIEHAYHRSPAVGVVEHDGYYRSPTDDRNPVTEFFLMPVALLTVAGAIIATLLLAPVVIPFILLARCVTGIWDIVTGEGRRSP